MELKDISKLKDTRTDCYSFIFEITVKDYLILVEEIYKEKGGIKEQREPLKTSSAMRIRKQMVKDIKAGSVLPPIVLGLIISEEDFKIVTSKTNEQLAAIIEKVGNGNLTIIDGMQRTTALLESIEEGLPSDKIIRIELWISTKLNSLIYRMLVLNTGQVPWNLRRQVETVFSTMINEMKVAIPEMEVYKIDDGSRRTKGGQYHANDLIELYLAFGGRKEKVDTKERLADEFTRLDFIEVTEDKNFSDFFYTSLRAMTLIDIEFSRFEQDESELRFGSGKDLFKSQPARVGFITSLAKRIFGRPGTDKKQEDVANSFGEVDNAVKEIISKVQQMNPEELGTFLSLSTLSEKLSVKSSRVGDFEREFFTKSFDTLFEIGNDITSMEVCWLSY